MYFAVAFAVVAVGQLLWESRSRLHFLADIYGPPFRDYLYGVGLAVLTISTVVVLHDLVPSFLRHGWFSLLTGTDGSLATAPITAGRSSSSSETGPNLGLIIVGVVFWAMLVAATPFIAQYEERMFRAREVLPGRIVLKSTLFGLMHLVVGIPVYAAFALIVTGLCLGLVYRRAHRAALAKGMSTEAAVDAGLRRSTRLHAHYNFTLTMLLLLGIVLVALAPAPGSGP